MAKRKHSSNNHSSSSAPADSGKSNNQSSKPDLIDKIVLVSIFFGTALASILAFWGVFNPQYTYVLPKGSASFAPDRFSPSARLDELNMYITFQTTSFSAQNPITVDFTAKPSSHFYDYANNTWSNQEKHMFLIFPTAYSYPLERSAYDPLVYKGAMINLTREDSPPQYHASKDIVFQFGGNNTFYLVDQDWINSHYSADSGISFTKSALSHHSIIAGWYFQVANSDQTTLLRTNNIVLLLTFLLVGFAFIEVRNFVAGGIKWLLHRKSRPGST